SGTLGRVPGRLARGHHRRDPEVDELLDAVLDIQAQTPERLHQRLDVEAFVGTGADVTKEPGTQGGLDQTAEACVEIRRLGRFHACQRAGATCAEGQIV